MPRRTGAARLLGGRSGIRCLGTRIRLKKHLIGLHPGAPGRTDDFALEPTLGWAVWTPVPEPGTAVLMGLGLLAQSVRNRRRG